MNQRLRKACWAALGAATLIGLIGLLWRPAADAPSEAEAWHTVEDVQQYLAGRGLLLYVPPHSLPDEGILTTNAERARQRFDPESRGVVSIRRFASPGAAADWASMRPTKHLRIGPWYFEGDPEMLAAIASRQP